MFTKTHILCYYSLSDEQQNAHLIKKEELMINWHKKQLEWWKKTFGISDYAVVWISFIKGVIIGLLTYHFLIN